MYRKPEGHCRCKPSLWPQTEKRCRAGRSRQVTAMATECPAPSSTSWISRLKPWTSQSLCFPDLLVAARMEEDAVCEIWSRLQRKRCPGHTAGRLQLPKPAQPRTPYPVRIHFLQSAWVTTPQMSFVPSTTGVAGVKGRGLQGHHQRNAVSM